MYFEPCEIVHTEVRWVVSPFCRFPWPCNELPSACLQAAVTPGCVVGSPCHHLTPAPLNHEETKIGPNGSLSLFCFVCSSFAHSLFVEDWFEAGGHCGALRDAQSSPMNTFSPCVISQQGLVGWLVSQAPRNCCCVRTPLRWWQPPWEGVLQEGRVWEGFAGTAGKCTCEGYVLHILPHWRAWRAFMACTSWPWPTGDI